MYEPLGIVTIAMAVTSKRLHELKWIPDTDLSTVGGSTVADGADNPTMQFKVTLRQAFEPLELGVASTFACIAMLESGSIDLPRTGLDSVMAMSSGDLLFVANTYSQILFNNEFFLLNTSVVI